MAWGTITQDTIAVCIIEDLQTLLDDNKLLIKPEASVDFRDFLWSPEPALQLKSALDFPGSLNIQSNKKVELNGQKFQQNLIWNFFWRWIFHILESSKLRLDYQRVQRFNNMQSHFTLMLIYWSISFKRVFLKTGLSHFGWVPSRRLLMLKIVCKM